MSRSSRPLKKRRYDLFSSSSSSSSSSDDDDDASLLSFGMGREDDTLDSSSSPPTQQSTQPSPLFATQATATVGGFTLSRKATPRRLAKPSPQDDVIVVNDSPPRTLSLPSADENTQKTKNTNVKVALEAEKVSTTATVTADAATTAQQPVAPKKPTPVKKKASAKPKPAPKSVLETASLVPCAEVSDNAGAEVAKKPSSRVTDLVEENVAPTKRQKTPSKTKAKASKKEPESSDVLETASLGPCTELSDKAGTEVAKKPSSRVTDLVEDNVAPTTQQKAPPKKKAKASKKEPESSDVLETASLGPCTELSDKAGTEVAKKPSSRVTDLVEDNVAPTTQQKAPPKKKAKASKKASESTDASHSSTTNLVNSAAPKAGEANEVALPQGKEPTKKKKAASKKKTPAASSSVAVQSDKAQVTETVVETSKPKKKAKRKKAPKETVDSGAPSAVTKPAAKKAKQNAAPTAKEHTTKPKTLTKETATKAPNTKPEKSAVAAAAKENTSPSTTQPKKKKKKKLTFQDQVFQHMLFSYKPFSLKTLAAEMKTTESSLNFLMLSLIDKGAVIKKEFTSKSRTKELYWVNYDTTAKELRAAMATPDEMQASQREFETLQEQATSLDKILKDLLQGPSNEELTDQLAAAQANLEALQTETQQVKSRIQRAAAAPASKQVKKSAAQLAKERCPRRCKIRINHMRGEWKSRKEKCVDFIDQLADGMEKKPKDVIKLLDLETDEMMGVTLPPKQVLDEK